MRTKRHRVRSRPILSNFTPLELQLMEILKDHLTNGSEVELIGVSRQDFRAAQKGIYRKTRCANLKEFLLYTEVYFMAIKNDFRNINQY